VVPEGGWWGQGEREVGSEVKMLRYLNMCLWFDVYFFEYIFSCLIFVWTLGDLLESPRFFLF
jgi:hypothetical protein